jgi:hypothetical protein
MLALEASQMSSCAGGLRPSTPEDWSGPSGEMVDAPDSICGRFESKCLERRLSTAASTDRCNTRGEGLCCLSPSASNCGKIGDRYGRGGNGAFPLKWIDQAWVNAASAEFIRRPHWTASKSRPMPNPSR